MRALFVLLLSFYAAASTTQLQPGSITVRADFWCPYNCDPKSENPGYIIEILRAIFENNGYTIDYQIMPWQRSLVDCREGKIGAIVGAYKTDCEGCEFSDEPLGYSTNRLFALRKSSWKYSGIDSLKGHEIGVINGYTYDETSDALVNSHHPSFYVISGDDALEKLIKMTLGGRIAAFYENPLVVQQQLRKMQLPADALKEVGAFQKKETPLYAPFCKGRDDSKKLAKMLSSGIKRLRKSGQFRAILDKYSVPLWN